MLYQWQCARSAPPGSPEVRTNIVQKHLYIHDNRLRMKKILRKETAKDF